MHGTPLSLVLSLGLALGMARSCGFTPDELKSEGEPCTRSDECELFLECRGGVCMRALPDGGPDASAPSDASTPRDASTPTDASVPDASIQDGSTPADAGTPADAATPADASTMDAAADASSG